ncbi:MAG: zinc metalloprotease HtpX [Chloroflexales bacterium]|nr:zinc metalloprotease HtpX [Chloroflexales bacterium]
MQFWNTMKTGVLLAALTGMFVVIGSALGGQVGMVIAFIFAIALNMGAWWFSDKLALRMSGAREVTPAEAPDLHEMVEVLSARAGIPKPRVYIIDSEAPNAFATGRSPSKGAVAVTTGIARMLTRDELAGVVAHELAHIKHRDTLISSIAATIAGAITMLAEMAMWASIFGGFGGQDEEDSGIAGMIGGILMIILAPIAALLIQMAISRSREFSADAGGARILGDPLPLASALEKLEWAAGRVPMQTSSATSHLYIVNPLRGGGLSGLFRTHPNTTERIARLRALPRASAVA